MEPQIKVSIICNVYNHGKYVRDALEGFVMQKTDFPFEVLVHDDASTDDSAAIIREYEEKYPNLIKPIYQTVNQYSQKIKIISAFQRPRVQGKYVAMCEGDDYWTDPLKLQKQYDFMEANPEYSMCTSSVVWLDMRTNKQEMRCRTDKDKDVSLEEIILEKKGRIFQYATFFIKKEVFCTCPEWVQNFGVGDLPMAIYASTRGKVRMLADVMAVYRNHAAGSYTTKLSQSPHFVRSAFTKTINGLTAFNEATDYAFNELVASRIKTLKYNIAKAERDLKTMLSKELREVYKSKRLAARASDILCCIAPGLQKVLVKLFRKSAV